MDYARTHQKKGKLVSITTILFGGRSVVICMRILIGVAGQGTTMSEGTEARNILHGRHENSTIHDEVGMRHYYAEWGKFLGVNPSNPLIHLPESLAA